MLVNGMNLRTGTKVSLSDVCGMIEANRDADGILQCYYCGRKITEDNMLHLDHFVPIKRGGLNIIENLVPACKYCNRSKLDEDAVEWYRVQLFFNKETEDKLMLQHNRLTAVHKIA